MENLLLHLVNTGLALWLFWETMPLAAAALAAALFALHPIQAEAVSLAAGRPELLATCFALLSAQAWRRRRHWLAALCFLVSLLGGPAAAALPIFFALVEASYGARRQGGVAALITMSALSSAALFRFAWAHPAADGLDRFLDAGPVFGHFTRLLVLPAGLSIWPEVNQSAAARFAAWMLLALLAGAALSAFNRLRLGFWFLAGLVLLAPSFALFSGPEAAADRRLYLPMLAIAAVAGRILESTHFPPLLPAAVALLAGLTVARSGVWQSQQALWEEAAQESPGQLRPRLELARLATPRRALELLLEAKAAHPNEPRVAAQLGATYLALHLPSDAVQEFGRGLGLTPGSAELHLGRGQALAELQLNDAALTDFEKALALNPCSAAARAALHLRPLAECARE